jgi:hypothetical protein
MTYLLHLSSNFSLLRTALTNNEEGNPKLLSFVLIDRDQRYSVTTCSSLGEGRPYVCERFRQFVNDIKPAPEKSELTIPQPIATEIYNSDAGKIDKYNRDQQTPLGMETNLKTHN